MAGIQISGLPCNSIWIVVAIWVDFQSGDYCQNSSIYVQRKVPHAYRGESSGSLLRQRRRIF